MRSHFHHGPVVKHSNIGLWTWGSRPFLLLYVYLSAYMTMYLKKEVGKSNVHLKRGGEEKIIDPFQEKMRRENQ